MVETKTGIFTTSQMAVRPLVLCSDTAGTPCTLSTDALTVAGKLEYVIDASAGAGDYYFYIDPTSTQSYKLIGYSLCVDENVTLGAILEEYMGKAWRENTTYQAPYGGGTMTGTEAQKVVPVYPLEQCFFKSPTRIKCTVGGACNIYMYARRG